MCSRSGIEKFLKLQSKSKPSISRRLPGSRSESPEDKAIEDLHGAEANFMKSRR